ncbi:MAG TPA: HAMP domain-containing protein, partial [Thermoanaerobaculia bacterium]|nr:HAMP domain-containing protein [Thermoanaerobaculia bacterium]
MRNENPTPSRPGGLGLRSKLTLGVIGLLAILLAVGIESITLLDQLGGSIDVILRENYKSVLACERMKESLERMDSGALFGLAGEEARGRSLAEEHRPRFETALQTELGNITLPGEGERAERLRQLYAGYVPVLGRVLDPAIPVEERSALYFGRLLPTFQQIKATADEILQMNQQNMVEANDRARTLAAQAGRRMALLLLLGTALAGICIAFLLHSILGPLERLTRAARQIERGDLDQTVPVATRDEIGQLAAAFNSMTESLRELRKSNQAQLLRARRMAELAIDNVPEAVAVLSADHRVELANRSATSLLGLRPAEPFPTQHGGWLPALLKRAEAGLIVAPGTEAEVRLPSDGRERFYRPRATVLRDGPDQPESFVLVVEDTTDRRRGGEMHASLLASTAGELEGAL